MDLTNPPSKYWHCRVKLSGQKQDAIVNDATFEVLSRTILEPWNGGRAFTVSGVLVNPAAGVAEIQVVHTDKPKSHYAEEHDAKMRASGIADMATNRSLLPFRRGSDLTFELLLSGRGSMTPVPDTEMVVRICQRLPQVARVMANRSRRGKSPFDVADEYDVQDLLHATLRAYLKHSVQEDPLPRVASAKSSRADISIEDLGILIEIKYVHGPEDQKRIFEEFSQDLVLYAKWPHLKTLIFVIYNSVDLRDAEAFEKLSATHEIAGRRFDVRIVLA